MSTTRSNSHRTLLLATLLPTLALAPASPTTSPPSPTTAPSSPRLEIATLNGNPIYLDELSPVLQERILTPLLQDFSRTHAKDITPTPAEIQAFLHQQPFLNLPADLRPDPDIHEKIARMIIERHKLQIALYRNFGGGRVLFQQAGIEAFDAMRRFLESAESAGQFSIPDPHLRAQFYLYWTRPHGAFLSSDAPNDPRIHEFLNPFWSTTTPPTTSPTTQP